MTEPRTQVLTHRRDRFRSPAADESVAHRRTATTPVTDPGRYGAPQTQSPLPQRVPGTARGSMTSTKGAPAEPAQPAGVPALDTGTHRAGPQHCGEDPQLPGAPKPLPAGHVRQRPAPRPPVPSSKHPSFSPGFSLGLSPLFSASPGPLAQLVELRTFNPLVVGSSPTGPTTPTCDDASIESTARAHRGPNGHRLVTRCAGHQPLRPLGSVQPDPLEQVRVRVRGEGQ